MNLVLAMFFFFAHDYETDSSNSTATVIDNIYVKTDKKEAYKIIILVTDRFPLLCFTECEQKVILPPEN